MPLAWFINSKKNKIILKVIVLGASPKPNRYSYQAVISLARAGYEVIPLGNRENIIEDRVIRTDKPMLDDVDTVTMYLNPSRQEGVKEYIYGLKPRRVIFNPGTYHPEFMASLKKRGIQVIQDCVLMMLSSNQF